MRKGTSRISARRRERDQRYFDTHASRAADIGETEPRLLVAIRDVVRLGFALRDLVALPDLRRCHLILRLGLLLHIADGARHESVVAGMRQRFIVVSYTESF